jgi:phosphonate transport system substrate-binding protein
MGVHLALLLLFVAGEANATGSRDGVATPAAGYVFAVVPQAPPVVMSLQWAPILEAIGRETGIPLQIKLYEQVEAFQADLVAGAVDLAYLNPVQAIRAFRTAQYRPLVRDEQALRGVFIVTRDSEIASMEALAGREVAFVGPWSFCSVTLRHEVRGMGVVPRFVGTSANAWKHVLLGLVAAGGVLDSALEDTPPDVRERLRVIYATDPMAPHPVVAHPRVPASSAARIADAFLRLSRTPPGLALLRAVHMPRPVVADYARDYEPLERTLGNAEVPGREAVSR